MMVTHIVHVTLWLLAGFGTVDVLLLAPHVASKNQKYQRNELQINKPRVLFAKEDDEDNNESDTVCGNGFYKQTGPDGDYCVFDYDAAAEDAAGSVAPQTVTATTVDEHYWDALVSQNKARKKFGLKPLTSDQYIALQAQNHIIARKQIADATAKIFSEFDTNQDDVISLEELQQGLETSFGKQLDKKHVEKLFLQFDTNGDGVLQPDEFVTLDELRTKLEAIITEEEALLQVVDDDSSQQQQPTLGGTSSSMFQNFLSMFQDTCQSNFDCDRPEVCCDLGYKKMCCDSGEMAKEVRLEYATVPVPQNL